MADNISFKVIDNIERFTAELWKTFPSLILSYDKKVALKPFIPLFIDSEEFCKEILPNGKIKIQAADKGGSFGNVGGVTIYENDDNKGIFAVVLSLNPENIQWGNYDLFFMQVTIKVGRTPKSIDIYGSPVIKDINETITNISISDPFSEAFFGAFTSNIFDLGLTPLPMKTFGVYLCQDPDPYKPPDMFKVSSLLELCDFQFQDLFNRDKNYLKDLTSFDVIELLFQFIYGMFCLKYYYGFVHFDSHLGNIMLKENTNYYYHGKDLSNIDYISYEMPFFIKDVKTCHLITSKKYIVKLIDLGFCLADLSQSQKMAYPLAYSTITPTQLLNSEDIVGKSLQDKSYANTIDIYFTLLCIYFHLKLGLDKPGFNANPSPEQTNLLAELIPFLDVMFKSNDYTGIEDYINKNQLEVGRDNTGNYHWTFHDRDVGTNDEDFSNQSVFLYRIYKYFKNLQKNVNISVVGDDNVAPPTYLIEDVNVLNGNNEEQIVTIMTNLLSSGLLNDFSDINPNNTLYLSIKNTTNSKLNEYINYLDNYYEDCETKNPNTIHCKKLIDKINKADINNVFHKTLTKNVLELNSSIWDKNYDNIKQNTSINNLGSFETFNFENKFKSYLLTIYPEQLDLNIKYNEKYKWFNNISLSQEYNVIPVQLINLHILAVLSVKNIFLNTKLSIDEAARKNLENYRSGFTTTCGSVVTFDNLNNTLTPELNKSNLDIPIGYYYNIHDTSNSGTLLPIPNDYINFYSVVYIQDNKITIKKYIDFLYMHYTIDYTTKIEVEEGGNMVVKNLLTRVIALKNKNKDLKDKVIYGSDNHIPDTGLSYSLAFTTGPILIWNKTVVFDINTYDLNFELNNSLSSPTYYKVDSQSQSTSKFSSNNGEIEFPYNQRNADHIMSRSVLAQDDKNNNIIFIIEGEGFNSPGLTVDLLTQLISRFNIKTAVLLNSKCNANALVKKDNKFIWLFTKCNTDTKDLCITFAF